MSKHKQLAASFLAGRERSCEGKKKYPDEAAAKEMAMLRSGKSVRLEAYECPFCGGWHIGRRQNRQ